MCLYEIVHIFVIEIVEKRSWEHDSGAKSLHLNSLSAVY